MLICTFTLDEWTCHHQIEKLHLVLGTRAAATSNKDDTEAGYSQEKLAGRGDQGDETDLCQKLGILLVIQLTVCNAKLGSVTGFKRVNQRADALSEYLVI